MRFLSVMLAAGLLAAAAPDEAMNGGAPQRWRGAQGWGQRGAYNRMFDAKTLETVSGEVEAVHRIAPMKGMSRGVHLTLKTGKEKIEVHLGPAWYIEQQEDSLSKGDKVEVRGSRVKLDGGDALIAIEVRKGDAVLRLRDEDGYPLWSGWRRRAP